MSGTVHVWRTLRSSPSPPARRVTATSVCWFAAMWCRHNDNLRVFFPSNWPDSIKNPVKKIYINIYKSGCWATSRLQDRQEWWKRILNWTSTKTKSSNLTAATMTADRNNLTCPGGQNPRTGNVNGSSGRNPTINPDSSDIVFNPQLDTIG